MFGMFKLVDYDKDEEINKEEIRKLRCDVESLSHKHDYWVGEMDKLNKKYFALLKYLGLEVEDKKQYFGPRYIVKTKKGEE